MGVNKQDTARCNPVMDQYPILGSGNFLLFPVLKTRAKRVLLCMGCAEPSSLIESEHK